MIAKVPTFALYGEQQAADCQLQLHCETIACRSSAYRWEIKRHRHDNLFQILYIRDGTGDVILDDRIMRLTAHSIVTVPPSVIHGFRFSQDVDGFVITVAADHLPLTTQAKHHPTHRLAQPQILLLSEIEDGDYIGATIEHIVRESRGLSANRNELLEAALTTALMLIDRNAASASLHHPADLRLARVEMLKDLISRHFRDHHPAAHYARLLNLSPTHLNRVVREVTGLTVHDLIVARVVEEARRALVFTSASVQQIAYALGFSDPAYFVRCFKRRTGRTPGAFRKSERLKLDGKLNR